MMQDIFLETDRLVFRRLTMNDGPLLTDLDSDPEVMRYLTGGRPTPLSRFEEEILPRVLRYYESYENFGYWAAYEKETQEFIGWFHFRPDKSLGWPDSPTEIELGYRFKRSAWGKGYGTEGSRALIDKAFTEWGVTQVFAQAHVENIGSRRVMEKCGLSYERDFIYYEEPWDEAQPSVHYVLTAEQYAAMQSS